MTRYEGTKKEVVKDLNKLNYLVVLAIIGIGVYGLVNKKEYILPSIAIIVVVGYLVLEYLENQNRRKRYYLIEENEIKIEPSTTAFGEIKPIKIEEIETIEVVVTNKEGFVNLAYRFENIIKRRTFVRLMSVAFPEKLIVINTNRKSNWGSISYIISPEKEGDFVEELIKTKKQIEVREIRV